MVARRLGFVVVVEDDEELRSMFADALAHGGWGVRTFATAEEALLFVRGHRELPAVVLSDFNAGDLSGPGLARELRSDPSTRDIMLVGMSGSVHPTPHMLSFFDLFVPKPVNPFELDQLLRELLATQP